MSLLPPSFCASLIGAVAAPHDDKVPPLELTVPRARWAALHCVAGAGRVQTFHAANDSLPPLDYKQLLAAEEGLAWLLLTNTALEHDALVSRLDALFPSAPKLCAALRTNRLFLNGAVVDGTVGAVLHAPAAGWPRRPAHAARGSHRAAWTRARGAGQGASWLLCARGRAMWCRQVAWCRRRCDADQAAIYP
jgi:hypothetical protein